MLEIENGYIVDSRDFREFVKEYYDREIDPVANHAEYLGNDSFLEITVGKDEPEDWYPDEEDLAADPEDAMKKWLSNEDDFRFLERELGISEALILWDLCRKNVIPEGTYILKIWW